MGRQSKRVCVCGEGGGGKRRVNRLLSFVGRVVDPEEIFARALRRRRRQHTGVYINELAASVDIIVATAVISRTCVAELR